MKPMRPRSQPSWGRILEARTLARTGEQVGALERLEIAAEEDPGDLDTHVAIQRIETARGRNLSLRRRYRAVGGYLAGRLETDKYLQRSGFEAAPEPWRSYGLGNMALAVRDRALAAEHFARALAQDPGFLPARIALAGVFLDQGRVGAAEAQYRAVLWQDARSVAGRVGMSSVESLRGRRGRALDWLIEALRESPASDSLAEMLHGYARGTAPGIDAKRAADALMDVSGGSGLAQLYAGRLLEDRDGLNAGADAFAAARAAGATPAEVSHLKRPAHTEGMDRFLKVLSKGVRSRYRHYALSGESESFDEFVSWVRSEFEQATGEKLGPAAVPQSYAFIGKIIDATLQSDDPLVLRCAKDGVLLLLGQRSGGPPEALAAEIARREAARAVKSRGRTARREAVWLGRRYVRGYQEWIGGGDLAGLALEGLVLIDREETARWEGDVKRRRLRLAAEAEGLLAEEALRDTPVTSVRDPGGVGTKLLLSGPLDFAEEVLVHENAHLIDAARHLPITHHPFRNLFLALGRGFSREAILGYLERNAQLTAIAEGPQPRAGLATCCLALNGGGAHSRGYTEIVEGMVSEIHERPDDFPAIDTSRVIVQQLHRLTEDEVRELARVLATKWGVRK